MKLVTISVRVTVDFEVEDDASQGASIPIVDRARAATEHLKESWGDDLDLRYPDWQNLKVETSLQGVVEVKI